MTEWLTMTGLMSWSDGLLHPSWWQVALYTLVATHITIVSVTVFLHRHAAHRALDLHPVLAHAFRLWLWLTTGMVTKEWASIHRKHHTVTDVEGDPHSPVVFGIRKVFWQGAELYRDSSADKQIMARFGAGLPNDWIERNLYSKYTALGVTLLAITSVVLMGPLGLTAWAMQMIWIPLFAAGVINGIGHYWGYRNFECPDAATNIVPWGILIGGEELHNNHHTYPNSAKLSAKWFEFDIGWMYIRLFEMAGLAQVRSAGPVVRRVAVKDAIDMDTLWAVVNDRFRVMARYASQVVGPLAEAESARVGVEMRPVMQRAKRLLCRTDMLVKDEDRKQIALAITSSPLLRQVYEARLQLQAVWAKRSGNKDELLAAFVKWCHEAEQSGIDALRDFVRELRTYSVPAAAPA